MLSEITLTDFAIADRLTVRLGPGLNVLTGETGAGKSIVVDALAVLLGGKADAEWVRAGAKVARIEGLFDLAAEHPVRATLADAGLDDDATLILSREIAVAGRGGGRVNARAVPLSLLTTIGQEIADIHGQADYLSLFRPVEQLRYLDRFAATEALADETRHAVVELRRLQAELASLESDERERVRALDRLQFEIEEISTSDPTPGEDAELQQDHARAANAEQLALAADAAYQALVGREGRSAADALAEAGTQIAAMAAMDAGLAPTAEAADMLAEQVRELGRDMRTFRDSISFEPERIKALEERISLLATLKRKYGDTIEDVLAYRDRAQAELVRLSDAESHRETLRDGIASATAALTGLASRLSEGRRAAASRLAASVQGQLAELGMPAGRFGVRFTATPDPAGIAATIAPSVVIEAETASGAAAEAGPWAYDHAGMDRVEFLVSLNRGEPLRPVAKVASGGETARLILALKSVLGGADQTSVLVFDEVDTGVGGRSGRIIGEKLARLAAHHQVLCITHLPQIACYADRHIAIVKLESGDRTVVGAVDLEGEARENELAAMLGGVTPATLASARELLDAAQSERHERKGKEPSHA